MSDSEQQPDKGSAADKAEGIAEKEPVPEPSPEKVPQQKPEAESKSQPASERAGGGGFLSILTLLIALAALGLGVYRYYLDYQQQQTAPVEETDPIGEAKVLIEQALQGVEKDQAATAQQLQSLAAGLESQQQQQLTSARESEAELQQLQRSLLAQRERLLELGSADRSDWMLAEASYLLRLAHQRLIMAADIRSAISLMSSADVILKDMDDAELSPVRLQIAEDLAALRAVPEFDLEGTWMRLQALLGQIDALTLFRLPDAVASEDVLPEDAAWQDRLQQGIDAAINRISSYVVIRRRQTPYEALIDPQWEAMVRQNMRMLIEQSRAGLLSRNPVLYGESIANARRWLGEFFSFNEAGVSALEEELKALQQIDVAQRYPDISGSLGAVKTVIAGRHRIESGQ